ncbi:hypothetical protein C8N24_5249 [Solirubrobacter pauli]|uniref:Uncharacterized protein n=1 Tax=Solirubrobacter pauli TaxID=166793 RepID=A0A660L2T2_9ACTN|nr:hypothetical protein [Solirubrobacter pauli]RKQ87229.1 hypothetical protein C8N24_5249 [Solirubrobacter pauli]
MRRLPTLTLLLGLTLLAPSAAHANRGYGAFEPYEDLAVVQTSDDGRELRSLTLRVQMACDDDRTYGWVADVKAARGALSPSTRGRNRLVVKRGSLHGKLVGRFGNRRDYAEYTGRIVVSDVREDSARVKVSLLRTERLDPSDRCRFDGTLRAERDPGTLYIGATDDDEPVIVRRHDDGTGVEWLSGFGTDCDPEGFVQGIHTDDLGLSPDDDTFGTEGLEAAGTFDPFGTGEYERWVAIGGRLEADRAAGIFRLVANGDGGPAETCDTAIRRWRAISS